MKLLVITQKIDRNDTILGFFHDWVLKMSDKFEKVEVICLQKGEYSFPENVRVYSLGKSASTSDSPMRRGKFQYVFNFYKHLSNLDGSYDKVFVHMNEEYVLLAGIYWKIKGIPVYFWRNHAKGSFLTLVSVWFSTKVFCTSTKSFTASFSKTVIMPAGVNTEIFKISEIFIRKKYSICMVGRVSPVKHIELALESVNILVKNGNQVSLSIVGDVPQIDLEYFEGLKKYVEDNDLSKIVSFQGGVSLDKLPEVYSGHEICLNLTDAGSFDKTIVEATGCGAVPLVSSDSFIGLLPEVCITIPVSTNIAIALEKLLEPESQIRIQKDLENFVESQSLNSLIMKLQKEIK